MITVVYDSGNNSCVNASARELCRNWKHLATERMVLIEPNKSIGIWHQTIENSHS